MTIAAKRSNLQAYLAKEYEEFSHPQPTDRLKALFSDFSKQNVVNVYAYNCNVRFWRSIILDANANGYLGSPEYQLAIEPQDLPDMFQKPDIGKPLALTCVIEYMLGAGDIMSLADFEVFCTTRNNWSSWMLESLVKSPLRRAWHALPRPFSRKSSELFVVIPTVKCLAKKLMDSCMQKPSRNGLNRLYTLSEFRSLCSPHNAAHLTDADLYLLLKYLHAQWGVAVADNVKGYGSYYTVVKFPDQAGHPTAQVTIDDNDKAMISLKTNCWALQSQVKELQSKIDELTDSLKKEYAQRHIPQALYLLKRKKNLLQLLERRMQILDTMESMLFRIEISQDDLQVVEAFNVGADTLRRILDQEDLSTASVSESMARVQDTLQEQQQVEDALVSGGESASYAYQPELKNDDALLDELNQLGESTETSSSAETLPLPIDTGSELARLNELFASLKTINTTLAQQHPTPSKRVAELA